MFTDRIKELREQRDMNKKEFSSALGMPYTTYNNYETGAREPNSDVLIKIATTFNVTVDWLLDCKTEKTAEPSVDINLHEMAHIKKYRALDEHGKDIIDYVLSKEYERCAAEPLSETKRCRIIPLSLQPASAGTGTWLDDNMTEDLEIPNTPEYKYADFAVRVSGDSMEPTYSDGDIILIHEQDAITIGDIGLFALDGSGYIKELGKDTLISHNKSYKPIVLNESVKCFGKVIGKIEN